MCVVSVLCFTETGNRVWFDCLIGHEIYTLSFGSDFQILSYRDTTINSIKQRGKSLLILVFLKILLACFVHQRGEEVQVPIPGPSLVT